MIHDVVLDEDHAQPAWVVTATVPVELLETTVAVMGLAVKVHGAACVTVKLFPAMVRTADRCVVPVWAATENPTVPLPLPVAPLEIVTHDAPLVAVQAQPAPVVTLTVPVLAVAATDWLAAEMLKEHDVDAAA